MKMLKKSLAMLLSVAIVFSACVVTLSVSAETDVEAPAYNAAQHEIITESTTVTSQNAIGLDETVYGSFSLTAATDGTTYNDRVVLYLGGFTHDHVTTDGATGSRTGTALLIFNRGDGLDLQMPLDAGGTFYWGANYKKFAYPDGTMNFTGPYEVAYSLSATNLTVWMNDTVVVDYDYNSWTNSGGTKYTTKLNSFATGIEAFGNPAVATVSNYKVWKDMPTPVYNAAQHEIVTESATVASQSTIGTDETVYGSLDLSAATSGTAYNDRVLLYLGHFTLDYSKTDGTTGSHVGKAYLVFNRHTDGIDIQVAKDDGTYFFWGANYQKYNYPDGTKTFTGPYEVVYSLSATNLTVWMNDIVVINYDYNSWTKSDGTRFTTTLNSAVTGHQAYGNPAVSTVSNYKVWMEKAELPVYDAESDKKTIEYNLENSRNTTLGFSSFGGNVAPYAADKSAKVVSEITVSFNKQATDYEYGNDAVFVSLAKIATSDAEKYLTLKFTVANGWYLALADVDGIDLISGTYVKVQEKYSNGTLSMPEQVNVVTVTEDNKISIWVDDALVAVDYKAAAWNSVETKIATFASEHVLLTGDSYSATGYTYTAIDNYGRLGDINGDCKINLLDVVAAKKILSNVANYEAFNSNVVKFDDTGSLNADGLAKIVNLLLNSITEEELYS